MKYAVIAVVNGTFTVKTEHEDPTFAIVTFHSVCTTLWNAPDVEHATVAVIDEKFNTHKIEYIKYDN